MKSNMLKEKMCSFARNSFYTFHTPVLVYIYKIFYQNNYALNYRIKILY